MEYKRYDTTLDNLKDQLNKFGVATIPNVLTKKECADLRENIWKELNYVTKKKFSVNNEKSWFNFYQLYPLHSMLFQHWQLGHIQPVWDIRQNESVGNVFSKFWNVPIKDLLVSFDGLSISLPPEVTKRGYYNKDISWLHTDQSPLKQEFCCIQGLVNLYPVNKGDSTLSILERSHIYHQDFFKETNRKPKSDWYKLQEGEKDFYTKKGCNQYCVEADEGSMILWDSRTIHQGIEPQLDREKRNFRMVVYVCMMPRDGVSKEILDFRISAFEKLKMTNHWAIEPKLFDEYPNTYNKPLPQVNPIHKPVLHDIGKHLVGY
jgi:hypothetical protein